MAGVHGPPPASCTSQAGRSAARRCRLWTCSAVCLPRRDRRRAGRLHGGPARGRPRPTQLALLSSLAAAAAPVLGPPGGRRNPCDTGNRQRSFIPPIFYAVPGQRGRFGHHEQWTAANGEVEPGWAFWKSPDIHVSPVDTFGNPVAGTDGLRYLFDAAIYRHVGQRNLKVSPQHQPFRIRLTAPNQFRTATGFAFVLTSTGRAGRSARVAGAWSARGHEWDRQRTAGCAQRALGGLRRDWDRFRHPDSGTQPIAPPARGGHGEPRRLCAGAPWSADHRPHARRGLAAVG